MINMNLTIVIPLFWKKNGDTKTTDSEPGEFIAKTPVNTETLERVIKSLNIPAHNNCRLIIVSAADSPDIAEEAETIIRNMLRTHYHRKDTLLFLDYHIKMLREKFREAEKTQFADIINLNNYSDLKNIGLVLSNLMESDLLIILEDDKTIEDPSFLMKAEDFIGKTVEGQSVFGKSGLYLFSNNENLFPVSGESRQSNIYWCSEAKINEAIKTYTEEKRRIAETALVFGGNMLIARQMFMEIPFDPNCIIGESEDYLINARMLGFAFFMDSGMKVRQIPSETNSPEWLSIRRDILHFLFERKKLQMSQNNQFLHPITTEEMSPYPGFFLTEDLNERIMNTSISLFQEYLERGEQENGVEATRNIKIATEYEGNLHNPAMEYFLFHRKWMKMMKWLKKEKESFKDILDACSLYPLTSSIAQQ